MRLQRMLGHLTTLVIERPRNVLVIGCGAGVTAGAVALDPRVERETIVEIELLVPRNIAAHFGPHNHRVLDDPRVRVRIDDARHHLLATRETFDAITSDPLDPWVKGAAAFFTEEFLAAARRRLNDGGVFTMFVQLCETSEAAVKSQLATFFRVFPDGVVFTNTQFGRGYDLVLLGRAPPAPIDVDAIESRLAGADMAAVAASLREVGIGSAVELLATFAGTGVDLAPWLADAAINRDSNLRLQYLAGLGINLWDAADIHARLLEHPFRFPQGVFTGSPDRLETFRAAVVRERGR